MTKDTYLEHFSSDSINHVLQTLRHPQYTASVHRVHGNGDDLTLQNETCGIMI